MKRLLKIFLVVAPILWLPGISQDGLQLMLLDYGSIVLFFLSYLFSRENKTRLYFLPVLMLSACVVSLISCRGFNIDVLHMLCFSLLAMTVLQERLSVRDLADCFACVAFINIFMFILQINGLNLVYADNQIDILNHPGLMARNYHLGYFLSFSSPLFLAIPFGWALALASLLVIIKVKSWACLGGFVLGMLALAFFKSKKLYKIIFLCALSVFLVSIPFILKNTVVAGHFLCRTDSWTFVLREGLVNPLFGVGLGTLEPTMINNNLFLAYSCSDYFKYIFELGLLPVCLIIFSFFYRIKINPYLIGALIAASFYPAFHEVLRFPRFVILLTPLLALTGGKNHVGID